MRKCEKRKKVKSSEAVDNSRNFSAIRSEVGTGLEGGDLVGDLGLALLVSELGSLVLLGLGSPVLALVGSGERGVLAIFSKASVHMSSRSSEPTSCSRAVENCFLNRSSSSSSRDSMYSAT